MSDHLVLDAGSRIPPAVMTGTEPLAEGPSGPPPGAEGGGTLCLVDENKRVEQRDGSNEEESLIQMAECRICQKEDSVSVTGLETSCACSGSLKYAHRNCVQNWCNERGDITCEIYLQPYQSGYTASGPPPHPDEPAIDIGGSWTISGTSLDLIDRLSLATAGTGRIFLEAEYDEYAASNDRVDVCSGAAVLMSMAILLLHGALTITEPDGEDGMSTFFSLILLRAAEFLFLFSIMVLPIRTLQHRHQRQLFLLRVAEFLFVCGIMAWFISTLKCRHQIQGSFYDDWVRQETATQVATQRCFHTVRNDNINPDLMILMTKNQANRSVAPLLRIFHLKTSSDPL
ncbi:uncharacterized protein LOC122313609 isoform X2 [Carya illinoinensis]|uniref:RING-CH-type domain-containing protein n=1 Tax=Carya illinoinensis TaxID=32201 RepID=A0A8T1Q9N0_CARIL|nr:uncharacterized protein LOC122313609 isoform X2 [Carya illinoinensis]KAG6651052.1 hypothetical protein CIPAW_06G085400 [Carya illinoinensis]KAG6708538.1 hypothetical protein I3842_06G085800 [Carya illinoinensis]